MARVLIVDDARFIRQMLGKIVATAGHEVVGEAADGRQAVLLYEELRPDIVTLDITMPELDGIGALREILVIDPTARVIVCSAVNSRPKVIAALQAGAKDFILKPVQPDRVIEALERVHAGRGEVPAADVPSTHAEEHDAFVREADSRVGTTDANAEPATAAASAGTATASTPAKPKILPWRLQQGSGGSAAASDDDAAQGS